MIFHSNFGVSEESDPLDGLLLHTVANLKDPPRVPHANPINKFEAPVKAKLRTKGYPISSTEGFVGPE